MFVKIHQSYRTVVAICDEDLLDKRFEEDNRQLEVRAHFFKGTQLNFKETVQLITRQIQEDASFNIVGKEAVQAAQEAGLIKKENILTIQNMPFTLTF